MKLVFYVVTKHLNFGMVHISGKETAQRFWPTFQSMWNVCLLAGLFSFNRACFFIDLTAVIASGSCLPTKQTSIFLFLSRPLIRASIKRASQFKNHQQPTKTAILARFLLIQDHCRLMLIQICGEGTATISIYPAPNKIGRRNWILVHFFNVYPLFRFRRPSLRD